MTDWQAALFLSSSVDEAVSEIRTVLQMGLSLRYGDMGSATVTLWGPGELEGEPAERDFEVTEESFLSMMGQMSVGQSLSFTLWVEEGSGAISVLARNQAGLTLSTELAGLSASATKMLVSALLWISCTMEGCLGMVVGWEVGDGIMSFYEDFRLGLNLDMDDLALVVRRDSSGSRVVQLGKAWSFVIGSS